MATTAPPPAQGARLTDFDRDIIAQARELGDGLRAATSTDRDRLTGWVLKELADLAERLGGSDG